MIQVEDVEPGMTMTVLGCGSIFACLFILNFYASIKMNSNTARINFVCSYELLSKRRCAGPQWWWELLDDDTCFLKLFG